MISGATRGAGGPRLGAHLANTEKNDSVIVGPSRGLVSDTIMDRIAELTRLGSHARTTTPVYHVHADPPAGRPFNEQERADYWTRFEKEFGFENQPFASAIQIFKGREHEHRPYLRSRPNGTAICLDHDFARREKVDRITEFERGEPLTRGAHNRAVLAALDRERPEVAAAMRAAKLHEGPRTSPALKPTDREQQDRTRVSKRDVARDVSAAWTQSDNGEAFRAALEKRGLRLAQGDKTAVVVDRTGNTHGVGKMLAMAARAEGSTAPKAPEIRARLDGVNFPSIDQARAAPLPQTATFTTTSEQPQAAPAPELERVDQATIAEVIPAPAPEQTQALVAAEAEAANPAAPASQDGQPAAPGSGGGAPAGATGTGGTGAALTDIGDGPGEPPGPNANPEERAKWLAKLAAWEDRRGAAWKRWVDAWNAENQKEKPSAGSTQKSGGDDAQHAAEAAARAVAELFDKLEASWNRARNGSEIRAAVTEFEAECRRIRAAPGGDHGTGAIDGDRSLTVAGSADPQLDREGGRNEGVDGPGRRDAARPDQPTGERAAEPDFGNLGRIDHSRREPGADRTAARKNFENAAAPYRLNAALAAQPDAMDRLRQVTTAFQPDPFAHLAGRDKFQALSAARDALFDRHQVEREAAIQQRSEKLKTTMAAQGEAASKVFEVVQTTGRRSSRAGKTAAFDTVKLERKATLTKLKDEPRFPKFGDWLEHQASRDPVARAVEQATRGQRERKAAVAARLESDRARVAEILSGHPHPDPLDRDPQQRADRYAGAISDEIRRRDDSARQAADVARKAAAECCPLSRALARVGIETVAYERAWDAASHADEAAESAARFGQPDDYKRARADGAAHAYAAQRDTRAWEQRPDVAVALEQLRLNQEVASAYQVGDPAIIRAMKAGDPEAARAEILRREEDEARRRHEDERRQGLSRGSPSTRAPKDPK